MQTLSYTTVTQEILKPTQTLNHTIMGIKYTSYKMSGEFVATDPRTWSAAYPWLPLALQYLGRGKGLVLHRTGLVYSQICQKTSSLPWVPQTSVAVSLQCFHYLYSCFNYAVKWPETMHRERMCVCMRVCVEIFNKPDCSTWVGLPVLNELCWGDACPGGLLTISFTWMVTMVLPFLCVCMMQGVGGLHFWSIK